MSLKKIIAISLASLLVLLVIFFIIFLPRFKVLTAYNRLALSAYKEPACHEQCFIGRRNWRTILLNNYDRFSIEKKIKRAVLSEEENLNFRKELVLLLSEKYDNSNFPSYLVDFLEDSNASWELKDEILIYFQVPGFNLASDLERIISGDYSDDEKARAVNALIGIGDDKYFDVFYSSLEASSSAALFRSVVIALSNISDKETYFSNDFINYIEDLIYLDSLSPKRKKDLIYLLDDASRFSNSASNILREISLNNELDDYTKFFASQALELPVKELSTEKWQIFSMSD